MLFLYIETSGNKLNVAFITLKITDLFWHIKDSSECILNACIFTFPSEDIIPPECTLEQYTFILYS